MGRRKVQSTRACWVFGMLILLIASSALAQEGEEQDPLRVAIGVLKKTADPEASQARSFTYELEKARKTLVEQTADALPLVTELLDDENIQIRVNAAIVLVLMANAGSADSRLAEALQRCVSDSSPAVTHWGLRGMLADTMPAAGRLVAIEACLKTDKPRPLRLATVAGISQKKLKEAVPLLIEHLKRILPAYKEQRDETLTYRTLRASPGFGARGAGGYGDPGYGIGGPMGGPRDVPMGGPRGGLRGEPMGLYGEGRGAYRGLGGYPGGQEGALGRRVIERRIDPEKLAPDQRMRLVYELEALPAVMELHHVGLVVEDLARINLRESLFGFDETPPWYLDQCVERAVAWLAGDPEKPPSTTGEEPAETPASEEEQPEEVEPAAAEQ